MAFKGAFGGNHLFPSSSDNPEDSFKLFTGVECPACRSGEMIVRYENGYRLGCSYYSRMGGGCSYADPERERFLPISTVEIFKRTVSRSRRMINLIRQCYPEWARAQIGLKMPEKYTYGPPAAWDEGE